MTFCTKIAMPESHAKSSAGASSVDACSSAQVATEAPVTDAPDARDVEAFADIMRQNAHTLQSLDVAVDGSVVEDGNVDAERDMPSMASLMAHMASAMHSAPINAESVEAGTVNAGIVDTELDLAVAPAKTDLGTVLTTQDDVPTMVAAQGHLNAVPTAKTDMSSVVAAGVELNTVPTAKIDMSSVVAPAVDLNIVTAAKSDVSTVTIVKDDANAVGIDDAIVVQDTMPNAYTASLLASMNSTLQFSAMQNPVTSVVTETASVSAPHFTVKEIDAMVNMLVERITTTDIKAHMVTVEVSLANTALRGTTVHLTRSLDGLLAVNVMTNDAATFQTLVGAQIDLRAKLEALDSGMVRVDISHSAQEQERDQNRRSATYQAYADDDEQA